MGMSSNCEPRESLYIVLLESLVALDVQSPGDDMERVLPVTLFNCWTYY